VIVIIRGIIIETLIVSIRRRHPREDEALLPNEQIKRKSVRRKSKKRKRSERRRRKNSRKKWKNN
jgi:hypothetical protein